MPPSIVITTKVLEYLATVAFGLVATTFLVARIFYVRRIARCEAGTRALERELKDLHGKIRMAEEKPKTEQSPAGRGQQIAAVIVAIGGLSALVAATTPLVHDFLEGKYKECNVALTDSQNDVVRLKGLLAFDANQWLAAEAVEVPIQQSAHKQIITLGQKRINNSGRASIAVTYDGVSPSMIDSDKSVTIVITLQNPSTGVRLLVRPIRTQNTKK